MPLANVKKIFISLIFYGLKEISTYVAPSLADAFTVAPNTSETNLMGTMTLIKGISGALGRIFASPFT